MSVSPIQVVQHGQLQQFKRLMDKQLEVVQASLQVTRYVATIETTVRSAARFARE